MARHVAPGNVAGMSSAAIAEGVLSDGLARRCDLLAAGVHAGWLRRRLATGRWWEPLPGVIDATGASNEIHGWLRCGLLFAGEEAHLSHRTAAGLHGLLPFPRPGDALDVTIPHGATRRRHPLVQLHRNRQTTPRDYVGGLWLSTVAATVVDLADQVCLNDLRCIAADAVRKNLTSPGQLQAAKRPPRGTAEALRLVVEELEAGAASGGEAAYWRAAVQRGLPRPKLNVQVTTRKGNRYVDGLFDDYRLGYEIDGRSVHAKAEAFVPDLRRHNDIQLLPLVLMRFAVSDVFTALDDVMAVTEGFLLSRAAELQLPAPKFTDARRRSGGAGRRR